MVYFMVEARKDPAKMGLLNVSSPVCVQLQFTDQLIGSPHCLLLQCSQRAEGSEWVVDGQ